MRAQGWAMVDQELEEGLRSVAAPIRDRTGRVDRRRQPVRAREPHLGGGTSAGELLPALLATAARIEADLRSAARRSPRRSRGRARPRRPPA